MHCCVSIVVDADHTSTKCRIAYALLSIIIFVSCCCRLSIVEFLFIRLFFCFSFRHNFGRIFLSPHSLSLFNLRTLYWSNESIRIEFRLYIGQRKRSWINSLAYMDLVFNTVYDHLFLFVAFHKCFFFCFIQRYIYVTKTVRKKNRAHYQIQWLKI